MNNQLETYVNNLLRFHNIKVRQWSVQSCGRAYINRKEVKIPKPTNADRFGVCIHEIKHIIDGNIKPSYYAEYRCEQFALMHMRMINLPEHEITMYKNRARGYVISKIAKAHARKLNLDKISKEVIEFCNMDFSNWKGKNVFVSNWGSTTGLKIHCSTKYSVDEIKAEADKAGFIYEYDDRYEDYNGQRTPHCLKRKDNGMNLCYTFYEICETVDNWKKVL